MSSIRERSLAFASQYAANVFDRTARPGVVRGEIHLSKENLATMLSVAYERGMQDALDVIEAAAKKAVPTDRHLGCGGEIVDRVRHEQCQNCGLIGTPLSRMTKE